MGTVIKQGIWNSVFIYTGILLGYINVVILFPLFLGDEQFGLTRILISIAFIAAQIASFGSPLVMIKYFPYFRDGVKKGLLRWTLTIAIIGFLFVGLAMIIFKYPIIELKAEKNDLLSAYYFYAIPIVLSLVLYNLLSAYLRAMLKSTVPLFTYEVGFRVVQAIILVLYFWFSWDLTTFMIAFVINYTLVPIALVGYLLWQKKFDVSSNDGVNVGFKKDSLIYGSFNLMTGVASSLINNIDILMLGWLIKEQSLVNVAYYVVAAYICAIIYVPYRSIDNISLPLVARMFKEEDNKGIQQIYEQTSLNQLLFCGILFIGIWINVDSLFTFFPEGYKAGKYVILFIGLARMFDVATGINGGIINNSPYYRFSTYFIVLMAFVAITLNLLLIPKFGLVGAALATSFSLFFYNVLKWIFVWQKMNFQPFTFSTLKALLVGGILLAVNYYIPEMSQPLIDIIVRSAVIGSLFLTMILTARISPEFNRLAFQTLQKLKKNEYR